MKFDIKVGTRVETEFGDKGVVIRIEKRMLGTKEKGYTYRRDNPPCPEMELGTTTMAFITKAD